MKKALLTGAFLALIPAVASGDMTGGPNSHLYHSDNLTCSDCHGTSSASAGVNSSGYGLKKGNITDLCLSCHREGKNTPFTADLADLEKGEWTAPIVMTETGVKPAGISMPAGDFYWSSLDPGNGHNPAYTKGAGSPASNLIRSDPVLGNRPPGGALTDGEWSCHSCHGSHSRFSRENSAWRQLKRRVNNRNVTGDVSRFGVESASGNVAQDPEYEPIKSNSRGDIQNGRYLNIRKDGNPLEGADLFRPEGDVNKNVYRGGFTSFCSACHGNFHGGMGETASFDNGKSRVNGT